MRFDVERMDKLPPGARFFDLNDLWYLPNRWMVRMLYSLPVSANHITLLSLMSGLVAAGFYLSGFQYALVAGAAFLYGKIFLDNVDGNLARARGEVSRAGRFLDSLTDFLVSVVVYGALTWRLVRETGDASLGVLGFLGLMSCLIHCSYFVFYLVKYTSLAGSYKANRADESVTAADQTAAARGKISPEILFLQKIHVLCYGWQDRLIAWLDSASLRLTGREMNPDRWYGDKLFLSLSSPLCLCTNNMLLVVFSLFDQIGMGLTVIVVGGNVYLAGLQMWKVLRYRAAGKF